MSFTEEEPMVVMFRTKGNSCLEPLKFNTGVSRRRGPLGLSPGTGVTLSVLGFDHVTRAKSYHYRTI